MTVSARAETVNANNPLMAPKVSLTNYITVLSNEGFKKSFPFFSDLSIEFISSTDYALNETERKREIQSVRRCLSYGKEVRKDKTAVMRFPPSMTYCKPFFFLYEDGGWRIDVISMYYILQRKGSDEWVLNTKYKNPYKYAFVLSFDDMADITYIRKNGEENETTKEE